MLRANPLVLCALALGPLPALADKPLTRHFGGEDRCYARSYTADHLARHPAQKVTHLSLSHWPQFSGPFDTDGAPMIYPDAPEIVVNISFALKDESDEYSATGFCWPEGERMACGLECDGGQFELIDRGADTILMRLKSTIYFHDCGDGDGELDPDPDDRAFLLHARSARDCGTP